MKDTNHTTFYVDSDIYHYIVMPLGLSNVNNTYYRILNKVYASINGVTMEAYVDDMLVNSVKGVIYAKDLKLTL